jgi:hypothetical protein
MFLRIKLTDAVATERGVDFSKRLAYRDELGLVIVLAPCLNFHEKSASILQRLLVDDGTILRLKNCIVESLAYGIRHLFRAQTEKRRLKLHRPRWPRGRLHWPATLSPHESSSTSFFLFRIGFIVLTRRFDFSRDYAEVLRRFWVDTVSLSEKAVDELLAQQFVMLFLTGCLVFLAWVLAYLGINIDCAYDRKHDEGGC